MPVCWNCRQRSERKLRRAPDKGQSFIGKSQTLGRGFTAVPSDRFQDFDFKAGISNDRYTSRRFYR